MCPSEEKEPVARTVREFIRELIHATLETVGASLEAADAELPSPASQIFATGRAGREGL
jgi:hypothetical protein